MCHAILQVEIVDVPTTASWALLASSQCTFLEVVSIMGN